MPDTWSSAARLPRLPRRRLAYDFPDGSFGGSREDSSWQPDPSVGRKEGVGSVRAVLQRGAALDVGTAACRRRCGRLGDPDCPSCGLFPSVLCFNRADCAGHAGLRPGSAHTGYPWECAGGLVMQAYLLRRCGYPAPSNDATRPSSARTASSISPPGCARRTPGTTPPSPTIPPAAAAVSRPHAGWTTRGCRTSCARSTLAHSSTIRSWVGRPGPGKNCGFADWWTLGLRRRRRDRAGR
jgi:hypothetical protein